MDRAMDFLDQVLLSTARKRLREEAQYSLLYEERSALWETFCASQPPETAAAALRLIDADNSVTDLEWKCALHSALRLGISLGRIDDFFS